MIAIRRRTALKMPPDGPLTDQQVLDLEEWIRMGAPDPRPDEKPLPAPYDFENAKKFWSFQPVKDPAPPQVTEAAWSQTPIDRFVKAKLDEKKLTPAIKSAFNLPLMTRFAVGPSWSNATPAEQQQLISAFSDFSVATYASRFTSYDGEQFKVVDEKPTSDGVIVETQLQPKDGDTVSLNYLMRKDEKGAWRICDVFLDGTISELATRRSEFGAIVQHDGIEALVNSLGEKSKQMGPS